MIYLLLLMSLDDTLPVASVSEHHIEVLEYNTTYDLVGKPVMRQWVCWDRYPDGTLHVVGWWVCRGKEVTKVGQRYIFIHRRGEQFHIIRADIVKRSHTLHDPELVDREWIGRQHRLELWK